MDVYLVGGAVRDMLLNLPIKDRDWVVVGATPQELLAKGYQQVGKDFPVFLHPKTKQEYALARTERKSGKGYTGFICDFNPNITLEQDLERRDLTINAMAMDANNNLVDPFNGLTDLKNRTLKHVSPAFAEDPLRVLRVARFAARYHEYGFQIAPQTLKLMRMIVQNGEMQTLTAERVWKETEKALSTNNPQVYFITLKSCGALDILFPELNQLYKIQIPKLETNLGELTLKLLKSTSIISDDLEIRFSALVSYFTNKDRQYNQAIDSLCDRFRIPNSFRKLAQLTHQFFQKIKHTEVLSPELSLQIFNQIDVWRHPDRLEKLFTIAKADAKLNTQSQQSIESKINFLHDAYIATQSISVKAIIEQGFTGKAIQDELFKSRIVAIKSLKNNKFDYISNNQTNF